jgi:hypothetical protein
MKPYRGELMSPWNSSDRLMILSSDAHAGALPGDYRQYLPERWHAEFDEWVKGIANPWFNTSDDRNWDSSARIRALDDEGLTGEVIFPNTLPPFYDILAHLSGVPRDRPTFERRWAGLQAHNRWLVEFCSNAPHRQRGLIQLHVVAADLRFRPALFIPAIGGVCIRDSAPSRPEARQIDGVVLGQLVDDEGRRLAQNVAPGHPRIAVGSRPL